MTVSSSARYSQVLHMVFNYMFLQACVSNCKIFPSFTLGFLFHAPSGLCLQVQDIHKFYTCFFITCSFRPVSPNARYSQVLHTIFYYMLLQACVSKCKIFTSFTHGFFYMLLQACVSKCKVFTSFTHGFLVHASSGLRLQVQDIHKFYTWFLITCSFRPVSPNARYSQVLHLVFYYMLLQACVSKCKIFTSFTHGFFYMLLQACVSKCKIFTLFTHGLLLHAPSGLCLQMQDIHKFYT